MTTHITKDEQKFIKQNLPKVDLILARDDNEADYKKICISAFDHWMTPEEFRVYNDIDFETLRSRRDKFETSVIKMYNHTSCYLFKFKRNYRVFIYRPISIEQVLRKFDIKNQTHMTGSHYALILPEYSAVYYREFDWTNILWYRDESLIDPLLKIVKESGLYILD